MNIFGIGPLEILLILLVALIIFGPKDIQKAGKTVGTTLNKLVRSESWRAIMQTSRELKNLPNRLMRESGMDEIQKKTAAKLNEVKADLSQAVADENVIRPPASATEPQGSRTLPQESGVITGKGEDA